MLNNRYKQKRKEDIFMGLKDIFNVSKIKEENENLKSLMTPEMQEANALLSKINELRQETERLTKEINRKQFAVNSLEKDAAELQKKIITFNDDILVQEFGLYQPRYHFDSSSIYAQNLALNREQQKSLLKSNMAVTGNMNFIYNNSKAQGNKMVRDMQKLLLRAFNSECDEIIRNVKYTNYDMSLRKLTTSSEAISKLGTMLMISITPAYFNLKKQELDLTIEYKMQQQEEKEALKAARAEQREQAKLQKEIEAERKKIEKEMSHYQTAYEKLNAQLSLRPDDSDLLNKKAELEDKLTDIDKALTDIDYRQANMKAGYVYIISNIGSFGENIYKIGMTRRLDPQERVNELGDASVPFNFDVHAMIFSNDAPALETALHHAFEARKVNMVNQRREFFNVTLEEIKEVIRNNFDKTVEFVDVPDAEQYRISQRMKA